MWKLHASMKNKLSLVFKLQQVVDTWQTMRNKLNKCRCTNIVLLLTITISLTITNGYSQDSNEFIQYIKNNAIEINNRTDTNSKIYNAIKDYSAILIGEMHGTMEPSEFLVGIVKSLAVKGKQVIVGLEIPNDQYDDIIKKQAINELKNSDYFMHSFQDGRQSVAWAQMIINLQNQKNIHLVFFDLTKDEWKNPNINRDSEMYLKINKELEKNPNSYLVTLSGNIHNQLRIRNNVKTMGYYLQNDTNSFFKSSKILSLCHLYGPGTMMNMMDGLFKIRTTEGYEDFYHTTTNYDNYLLIFKDKKWLKGFTGFIYSKTVSAAKPFVENSK